MKLKQLLAMALVVIMVATMLPVSALGAEGNPVGKSSITLNPSYLILNQGNSGQITVTASPGVSNLKWSSSDEVIATVSGNDTGATIIAKQGGCVTITASSGGISTYCSVTVNDNPNVVNPNSRVRIGVDQLANTDGSLYIPIGTLTNDNFSLTKEISKGGSLIKSILINDNKDCIEIIFLEDFLLERPVDPNVVLGKVEVKAKKDIVAFNGMTNRYEVAIKRDTVFSPTGDKGYRVGYLAALEPVNGSYNQHGLVKFVPDGNVTTGVATGGIDELSVSGPVSAGDKIFTKFDVSISDTQKVMLQLYPEADLHFLNLTTSGFPAENTIKISAKKDEFLYQLIDGKVIKADLQWNEAEGVWKGKTKTSVQYAISDIDLTPSDAIPPVNPNQPIPASGNPSIPVHQTVRMEAQDFALADAISAIPADQLNSDNFTMTKSFLKGANLVKSVDFNDEENCIEMIFVIDYRLEKPTIAPNIVIENISVTANRDIVQDGTVVTKKDSVYNYMGEKIVYAGHQVVVDHVNGSYTFGCITKFEKDGNKSYGEATVNLDELFIKGRVYAGDKIFLNIDVKPNEVLDSQLPDAGTSFYNVITSGFSANNTIQLAVGKDKFLYREGGNKLYSSSLQWDEAVGAWTGKIRSSTSYVISDVDLKDFVESWPPVTPPVDGSDDSGSGSDSGSDSVGGTNTANTPATSDKLTETIDVIKNLPTVGDAIDPAKLPAGVTIDKTANGSSIATIPVTMTTGNANLNTNIMDILGAGSSQVGLKITVTNSSSKGKESVEIIIPGGFGKITEQGRLSFPMDFKPTADDNAKMLAAVKTADAVSSTVQIGGNFNLPVAATVTVKSAAPEGSTVNVYKYDPLTGKMIFVASAKVVDGKVTFATKLMGQMLMTTGKL